MKPSFNSVQSTLLSVSAICILMFFFSGIGIRAQEQTIELKQSVVRTAKAEVGRYLMIDSLETQFQSELPQSLNRAIGQKMILPPDMRMLEWILTDGLSVEIDLNMGISVFWSGDLLTRKKMTDDPYQVFRAGGLTFEIAEQSIRLKNTFEIMQVFERFWKYSKNNIRVFRYHFQDTKKKGKSAWFIAIREESGAGTGYHFVALGPGMPKPAEFSVTYKNLFIENGSEKAPQNTFGIELGMWNEQYEISGANYTDILISASAEQADNGLLMVLRYQEQEFLGHGLFNYLETASK